MRSNHSKVTPPPPVPPRPSKIVVAEALAKSRRLSPVRVLYATQPLSAVDITNNKNVTKLKTPNEKPVVPIRTAPPPPLIKPKPLAPGKIALAQVFFNHKLRNVEDSNRIVRSASDVSDELTNGKSRTVIFQSSNLKSSKIEVNISRKNNSINRVESTKNERNIRNHDDDKQTIKISATDAKIESNHCVKINTSLERSEIITAQQTESESLKECAKRMENDEKDKNEFIASEDIKINPVDQLIDVIVQNDKAAKLTETIVQSSDKTTIIVTNKNDDANNNMYNDSDDGLSKKVQFDDKINHEILIAELQSMKEEQDRLLKRQRRAPVDIYDCDNDSAESVHSDSSRIHHSDWVEVANGEEVRLSSCQIYIDNDSSEEVKSSYFSSSRKPTRAPSMSSLHGLPPLPKSLSGFNLLDNQQPHRIETPRGTYRVPASPGPQTPSRAESSRGPTPPTPGFGSGLVVYPPHPRINGTNELPRGRKVTTLDTQLAILRREMVSVNFYLFARNTILYDTSANQGLLVSIFMQNYTYQYTSASQPGDTTTFPI